MLTLAPLRRIALVLPLALTAAACTPPAAKQEPAPAAAPAPAPVAADAATQTQLRAAIMPVLGREIGKPLSFEVVTMQTSGEWAWAIVDPRAPDGAPFDFKGSLLESAMQNGVLGDNGRSYFLLRRTGEDWSVRDMAIGPTDVAWMDWPAKHGAPPAVMELE